MLVGPLMYSCLEREEDGHDLSVAISWNLHIPCLFDIVRFFEYHGRLPHVLVLVVAVVAKCMVRKDKLHEARNPLYEDLRDSLDHLVSMDAMLILVEFELMFFLLSLKHCAPCVSHLLLQCVVELLMLKVSVVLVVRVTISVLMRRLGTSLFSFLEEFGQLLVGKQIELVGNVCVFDLLPGSVCNSLSNLEHA